MADSARPSAAGRPAAIVNDVNAACGDGTWIEPGVVILGTGSHVLGVDAGGERWRPAGGHVLGDDGSGYWLGLDGMTAHSTTATGPVPRLATGRRVAVYGLEAVEHLESLVYGKPLTKRAIAAFTEASSRLANEGDRSRIELLTEIGRKLGSGLGSHRERYDPELIVVGGGFFAGGELGAARGRRRASPQGARGAEADARGIARRARRARHVGRDDRRRAASRCRPTRTDALMPLAVCATPIGNLEDVTLRVLRELAEADLVLCEDTRRTRILLDRHGISARLVSYHEHNEAARTAEVLPRLLAGARVALVSDAGLPGVNDPGARLIAAALEAGVPVTVLPGASAVETALVASGFDGRAVPVPRLSAARRGGARGAVGRAARLALAGGRVRVAATAPGDAALARGGAAERPVAVCRELTKQFEEVVRGRGRRRSPTASREPPKGEITLVLGAGRRWIADGRARARSRPSRSSSPPASRVGRRPTSSPGSPANAPQRALPGLFVTKL